MSRGCHDEPDGRHGDRLTARSEPPGARTDTALALLLGGWVLLATYLFLMPVPGELTDGVDPTLGHSLIFAALGATAAAWLLPHGVPARRLFVAGLAGGIAIEVAQHLISRGRGAELGDVAADALGLAVGTAAVGTALRLVGRPGLVAKTTAAASAALLIAVTATTVFGPPDLRDHRMEVSSRSAAGSDRLGDPARWWRAAERGTGPHFWSW